MSHMNREQANVAFIFDLDGVVIDSMPAHIEAWQMYLNRHGIAADEIAGRMHGRRNDEIVPAYFGGALTSRQIFDHGAAKEALFREMVRPQFDRYLVPGVLQFLEDWDAVPTGLASNAEPANIDFVLDGAGIRSRFDVIVDGHQVERPKPHPDIYLRAAELLGFAPADCIVFEDSPTGIEAAVKAGTQVVAIQTHRGDLPAVDFSVRDFLDPSLAPWLRSRKPRR